MNGTEEIRQLTVAETEELRWRIGGLESSLMRAQEENQGLRKRLDERTREMEKLGETLQGEASAHRKTLEKLQCLSSLVENSEDAIMAGSLEGKIVRWNKGAERIFGYTEQEAVGQPITLLIPESRMDEVRGIVEKLWAGERVAHFETRRKRKDGSLIDVSLTLSPIRNGHGQIIGASAIARDITKRKKAEKALKERERQLFTLLGNLPGMVYRCFNDRNWTMRFISEGCFQLTGYNPSELVDNARLSYNELIHPDDRSFVWSSVQEALEKAEPYRMSYRIRTASGDEKWVWEQGVGVFSEEGELRRLEGYIGDISDLKRAEEKLLRLNEELEKRVQARTAELQETNLVLQNSLITLKKTQEHLVQSQKMAALGEIVSGVAHEINTPVGVAVTAASFLEMKTRDLANLLTGEGLRRSDLEKYIKIAQEASATILNNLNRAAELVKGFKQVAVDQAAEDRRRFKVGEYVHKVLLNLRPQYKRTRHAITVSCPDDLELDSYPGAFSQIISNLVINSLVHGFDGIEAGKIAMDIHREEDRLVFRYKDDGKGISGENLKKVFNPFFTTRRGQGGSGLGLHIVYNLITQTLKGRIVCRSELGKGTEFEMVMPIAQAERKGED